MTESMEVLRKQNEDLNMRLLNAVMAGRTVSMKRGNVNGFARASKQ